MVLSGNPQNFGSALPHTIETANPAQELPAVQTPEFLGVPWQALGEGIMDSSQRHTFSAPLVDAAFVKAKNANSTTPRSNWRSGNQIMHDYYDLGIKLTPTDTLSPEAEAFVVKQAADSKYRQSIIAGQAEKHPGWTFTGGLLGGMTDPIFIIPSLLTMGGAGLVEAGLLGTTARTLGVRGAATLGVGNTFGVGAAETFFNVTGAIAKPLPGLWGSRFVSGAMTNLSAGGAAYLLSEPARPTAGLPELTPQEAWTTILGGAAVGGLLHQTFGMIGDRLKLDTNNPRIQAKLGAALHEHTAQTAAGLTPDPQVLFEQQLRPELMSLGKLIDEIEGRTPIEDATPDVITVDEPAAVDSGSLLPDEQAVLPPSDTGELQLPADLRRAKPRYNYGNPNQGGKSYVPQFESDVDKALFIVAQDSPSTRNADYMAFLKKVYPDLNETQIKLMGKRLRQEVIKPAAAAGEGGDLVIPRSHDRFTISSDKEPMTVWRTPEGDQPVVVTGELGEYNGRKYVSIEGSETGIPADEIVNLKPRKVGPTEAESQLNDLAQEVAERPETELVTTPEERAILRATDEGQQAGVIAEQVRKLRDTVVKFGRMVDDALEEGREIAKDDSEFRALRNSANGAITSMKRALGAEINPESSQLLQQLSALTKKIASKDPAQVQAALTELSQLDGLLVKAGVLTPDDINLQLESLRQKLGKAEQQLGRTDAHAPAGETRAKWETTRDKLIAEIAELQKQVPEAGTVLSEGDLSPNIQELARLLGLESEGLRADQLTNTRKGILNEIVSRTKRLQDWQRSISPTTGEIVNPEAKLMQQYNEQLAEGTAKSPQDFLEQYSQTLDEAFKQAKSIPEWENTEFGKKATDRLAKIEEEHAAAMEKAKAFEQGAKQALACGLDGGV